MCPGLRSEMARVPSFGDREGPAQYFARSFGNNFTQFWDEMSAVQNMSAEALAANLCSNVEQIYVHSGYLRMRIFQEFFRHMFVPVALCVIAALAGLDVLSPHLSYPTIATASGGSRLLTGYFSLTISSARLFFNLSLYSAVCCLCLLLSLNLSSLVFNARQQALLRQPTLDQMPNAAQMQNETMVAQMTEVLVLPFLVFSGFLTEPLKAISLCSLVFATLATFFSFIFPSIWQLLFWGIAISVVFYVSCFLVASTPLPAEPIRDLEA